MDALLAILRVSATNGAWAMRLASGHRGLNLPCRPMMTTATSAATTTAATTTTTGTAGQMTGGLGLDAFSAAALVRMLLAARAGLVAIAMDAGTGATTAVAIAGGKIVATGAGLSCQSLTTAPSTPRSSSASNVGR
jgi:hypothetical protein